MEDGDDFKSFENMAPPNQGQDIIFEEGYPKDELMASVDRAIETLEMNGASDSDIHALEAIQIDFENFDPEAAGEKIRKLNGQVLNDLLASSSGISIAWIRDQTTK